MDVDPDDGSHAWESSHVAWWNEGIELWRIDLVHLACYNLSGSISKGRGERTFSEQPHDSRRARECHEEDRDPAVLPQVRDGLVP